MQRLFEVGFAGAEKRLIKILYKSLPRQVSFLSSAYTWKANGDEIAPYPVQFASKDEEESVVSAISAIEQNCEVKRWANSSGTAREPLSKKVRSFLSEIGLFGANLPFENGGLGFSNTSQVFLWDRMAQLSPSLALSLRHLQSLGSSSVVHFGTKEQRGKYYQNFVNGSYIATLAYYENNNLDLYGNLNMVAKAQPDGTYALEGRKTGVKHGDTATHFIVFANTETQTLHETEGTASTAHRLSMFIVEKSNHTIVTPSSIYSELFDVEFRSVPAKLSHMLGAAGEGRAAMLVLTHCGHITQAASVLGATRSVLKRTANVDRDICSLFYAAESVVYLVASNMDRQVEDHMMEDMAMKLFVNKMAQQVACNLLESTSISTEASGMFKADIEDLLQLSCTASQDEGNDISLEQLLACLGCEEAAERTAHVSTLILMQERALRSIGLRENLRPALGVSALEHHINEVEKDIIALSDRAENLVLRYGTKLPKHTQQLKSLAVVTCGLYARVAALARAAHAYRKKVPTAGGEINLACMWCAHDHASAVFSLKEIESSGLLIASTSDRIYHELLLRQKNVAGSQVQSQHGADKA